MAPLSPASLKFRGWASSLVGFTVLCLMCRWYHGSMDRAATDSILAGRRPGLFLVRDSTTCPGDYVLSVR